MIIIRNISIVLLAVLAGLIIANIVLRLMTAYYKRKRALLDIELKKAQKELGFWRGKNEKLAQYRERFDELMSASEALGVRMESYPDEIGYILEDMVPLREQMRRESYHMEQAVESGDMTEARACQYRGLAATEELEAIRASAEHVHEAWKADSELFQKMFKELDELGEYED
jgi:predicted  nucleic acid-binding Zn-ribbon protein